MTETKAAEEHVLGEDGQFHIKDAPIDLSGHGWEDWLALAMFWSLATVVFTIVFGVLLINPALLKNDAVLASALTAAIASAVFFGRSSGGLSWRFAMTLLLAVMLWETAGVSTYGLANRFQEGSYSRLKSLQQNSDIVEFFRTRISPPFRIEIDNNAIPYNFGDWYGVDTTGGYLASVTENVNQQDTYSDRAMQLLNVRYSVRAAPNRAGQTEVFVARSGVKVFENPGVLPRAWAVHDVVGVHNLGEVQHFMQTRDPAKTAVMIGTPPPVETCAGADSVSMSRPNVNAVHMRANMACRGMVVLSETFYPGWVATVDGVTAPIHQVYGMLRGVPVNAGSHEIEMRYRPKSVLIGFIMTVLGLLGAAIVAIRLYWPRRA
ncbi:MAG: YfhO family protein [Bryobacteraceae bacterium]